jgi:hypothetical protein
MVGSMIATYIGGALTTLSATGATILTTAGTAAAFAINFAVSTIITRAFADNPEKQQDMGVREQVPPSGVNAIPVVYGSAYMGGTFVDAVLANQQRKMYYVLAISSISPNGQFTFDQSDMWFGDQKIVFDSGSGYEPGKVVSLIDQAGNSNTKVSGNLFIYLFTSNEAGVITPINSSGSLPSSIMGGTDIAVGQRWPSSGRQMNGLAFAIVVMTYNQAANTTNLSPITFHVNHTLNGTGVAKPGDVWYDYITSKTYGGAVGWMPDGSFDSSFVDATSATALNTYSDELITFDDFDGNPQTQSRYRINGVLDAGQSVLSNIDRIMSSCDSWMTYNAALGQWSVVVNKPETTAYAFNDSNIIGDIRVSASDITSSINQVEARFPFKAKRDQASFVNIETPFALLYPNEPVNKYSITYDLVNDSVQANYLANRLLEQAREDLIVSFSTTYYGIQVNAGDVVSVTNADYGWNAKLFRVMKVNEASLPDGSLGAKLEMSEYSSAVYDNFNITQYSPVPNSNLPSVSYFSPLSAPTVTGYPSANSPNFDVQVYIPATGRVTFGNLFYTTSATPSTTDWKLLASATTTNSQPVVNGTYYTFANQILPAGTYYFAYVVGNDISQSILSPISSAFVWSPVANTGPFIDISGYTAFSKSVAGVITPPTATLTAITTNVTSPTYAWSVTGATPSTGSASTITVTPTSIATSVVVSLTVSGTNLTSPVTRLITMPIVLNGPTGGNGAIGLAALTAYKVQTQATAQPTFTTPTSGSVAPTGWYLTLDLALAALSPPQASLQVGYVVWYLQGQYNANTFTSNGVPASSTAWIGPVAASIFQDIRSNNWNGSTPPIFGTPATYGTLGYYIRQGDTVGSPSAIYINKGVFSGDISTAGDAVFNGDNPTSTPIFVYDASYNIDYSTLGNATTTATFGNARTGVLGKAISTGSIWNAGVIGYAEKPSGVLGGVGIGVVGSSNGFGGYFTGYTPSSVGLACTTISPTYTAFQIIQGKFVWGAYTINQPTGSTTTYLRNDGAWSTVDAVSLGGFAASSWARIFVGDTGTANAGGSGINFNCLITGYQFRGTSNIMYLEPVSDKRLKENIEPETLGLSFVNALKPVTYNMIGQERKAHGFIAQDVEPLITSTNDSLKIENSEGMKGVDYLSLIAPLVKAVQELSAQVEELKKQIPKT